MRGQRARTPHSVSPLILGLPTANVRDGMERRELKAPGARLSLEPTDAESKTSAPCTEPHQASLVSLSNFFLKEINEHSMKE